jgi:hypothetical protein
MGTTTNNEPQKKKEKSPPGDPTFGIDRALTVRYGHTVAAVFHHSATSVGDYKK